MDNCVFCKISLGGKKEEIIYDDEKILVVTDVNPRTPIHLLIIPKIHYFDYSEMMETNPSLLTEIGSVIQKLIIKFNLKNQPHAWGFHAGGKQSVNHVHAQLLSGMAVNELVL